MEGIVSEKNPIRVYVTHVFEESDDYLRVFEFLESVDRFYYLNCSDPANVPETGGIAGIKDAFIEQIKASEAVVALASVYADHTELIQYQNVAFFSAVPGPILWIQEGRLSLRLEQLKAPLRRGGIKSGANGVVVSS